MFWENYTNDPRLSEYDIPELMTWIQGDLHAHNYGIYNNDLDEIVYDLNDFDESFFFYFYYDLIKMATSLIIISEENDFKLDAAKEFMTTFIDTYTKTIIDIDNNNDFKTYLITEKNAFGKLDERLKDVRKENDNKKMLKKWTNKKEGKRLFDYSNPKVEPSTEETKTEIRNRMVDYGKTLVGRILYSDTHFKILDIVNRLSSGTGSYGFPRYYVLIAAGGEKHEEVILDIKLQRKPSAYHYLNYKQKSVFDSQFSNQGRRHARAYIAMSTHTDDYLGWMNLRQGVFSVRSRSPYKEYFDASELKSKNSFNKLAQQWGAILATNHCRANPEFDTKLFKQKINRKQSAFNRIITDISVEVYYKNNNDYKLFKEYIEKKDYED